MSLYIISTISNNDIRDAGIFIDIYRVGQRNPEKTYDDISDLYLRKINQN